MNGILQALIACTARTEPRFGDHLRERFVELLKMIEREHVHRETDDYAEEFIRAAMLLGDGVAKAKEPEMIDMKPVPTDRKWGQGSSMKPRKHRGGVQVSERNGIWEVRVDGEFRGDYHQKEHALAAAALHKLSPR